METPGHTPEALSLVLFDLARSASMPQAVFTGDTLFVGDVGRPDLGASAGWSAPDLAGLLLYCARAVANDHDPCNVRLPLAWPVQINLAIDGAEAAVAVVVRASDSTLDAQALREWCRPALGFRTPKRILFAEELPKNPAGKADKKRVRASVLERGENNAG